MFVGDWVSEIIYSLTQYTLSNAVQYETPSKCCLRNDLIADMFNKKMNNNSFMKVLLTAGLFIGLHYIVAMVLSAFMFNCCCSFWPDIVLL